MQKHIDEFKDIDFPPPYRLLNVGKTELDVVFPSFSKIPISVVPTVPSCADDKIFSLEAEVEKELSVNPLFDEGETEFEFWPRVVDKRSLFEESIEPSKSKWRFKVRNDGSFEEVEADNNLTSKNSTSLHRAPGNKEDFVRGSRKNVPFLPGGLGKKDKQASEKSKEKTSLQLHVNEEALLSQPSSDHLTVVRFTKEGGLAELTEDERQQNLNVMTTVEQIAATISKDDVKREKVKPQKDEAVSKQEFEEALEGNVADEINKLVNEYASEAEDGGSGHAEEKEATKEAGTFLTGNSVLFVDDKKKDISGDDELDELMQMLQDTQVEAKANDVESLFGRKKESKSLDWAVMERLDVSNFSEMVPSMAFDYPFELDTFQKEAVVHLERRESVFVAAHTSAGKTVVAEYAIALSKKHLTRTIYTSPIKALSNQKYRDFEKTFEDVGLITGDVQLNASASCLIMTTEILRSMLYRGADLIRDVEWVIFDECHYVSDPDRGVVWEEVIILLPDHVNLIFLSATVPNTFEFADWVGRVKKKKIHVIATSKRPTPLEHFLFAGKDLHKIVDKTGTFIRAGYEAAQTSLSESQTKSKGTKKQQNLKTKLDKVKQKSASEKQGSELSQLHTLVRHLEKTDLLPVVIFVYSKRRCESAGFGMIGIDLTTNAEKKAIRSFFEASITRLNSSDRTLPQILRMKELLSRGIGVHHSGVLPIVREVIEILFARGQCKVLFATETFAMGLNMPARSVVFNSLRKHDGTQFRDLLPGEFLQASGRAGRRGMDAVGTVIIACWHEIPDISLLKKLVVGKAERLQSQFRLTYNQILNLLRVEDFNPQDMMMRSFSETNSQKKIPERRAMLKLAKEELARIPHSVSKCLYDMPEAIEDFYSQSYHIQTINAFAMRWVVDKAANIALQPGRVVILANEQPAVVLQKTDGKNTVVKMLCLGPANKGEMRDVNLVRDVTSLTTVSKFPVETGAIMLEKKEALKNATKALVDLKKEGFSVLDPVSDLKINDIDFVTEWRKRSILLENIKESPCATCELKGEHYKLIDRREKLQHVVRSLSQSLSKTNLYLMPEFNTRLNVLKELEYIDESNVILIKGRVAREINSCDELISTEMIFESVLTHLEPAEAIALLSVMVFEEKCETPPSVNENLTNGLKQVEKIAKDLCKVQMNCGLDITERDYLGKLKPGLMEVVYEWANGMSFAEIMTLTDVAEGSIVRNIVRLEETCREFRSVARVIGDNSLFEKMDAAATMIKRDIIFTTSLYLFGTENK